MGRLDGSVAIVTGAGQGIGQKYAEGLTAEGARVVIAEINEARGKAVADALVLQGRDAIAVATDVSSLDSCKEMARQTIDAYGQIDVLINNAAVYDGLTLGPLDSLDPDEWDRVMSVNVKGVWQATVAVLPYMRERNYGRIINISSTMAVQGSPGLLHYASSKGAVAAMTRAMAHELGPQNIFVTGISPGMTFSEATEKLLTSKEMGEQSLAMQAHGEPMMPEHLVPLIVFLSSRESDFIIGQNYVIDGGKAMI